MAVRAVVGREEQRPVHGRQVVGMRAVPLPGLMSLTRTVPAAVPSLFHSSRPCRAVVGREEQRAVDVRQVARVASSQLPGLMSLTRTVPAAVPSLFHSSLPWSPSSAVKNSVPFTFVRLSGYEPVRAGVDVLDQDGAGGGAVALPQLPAVGAVVGREEQRPVHVRQVMPGYELPWPPG